MTISPNTVVESVTGVVQAAQGGASVGNSGNGLDAYINVLNLAGTIAGTTPAGVGLNAAASTVGTIGLYEKWTRGALTPADVMSVTSSVLGGVMAIAVVSGAPITLSAIAVAAAVAIVSGPGVSDWFNDKATGLGRAISDALMASGVNARAELTHLAG